MAEPGSREAAAEKIAAKNLFNLHSEAPPAVAESPPPAEQDGDSLPTNADGESPIEQPAEGLLGRDEHPSEDDENADPDAVAESTDNDADSPEGQINSLNDLATSLDTDLDTLFGLRVTARVDGVDHDVTLGEVLKSYRLESQVNKRSTQLGEQRKALETERAAEKLQLDQTLQQTGQFVEFVKDQLVGEVSQVNLAELAETDPAEAYRLHFAMQQRQALFDQKVQEFNQIAQQRAAEQQQQQQQYIRQQQEMLTEEIPEWNDAKVLKQEVGEIEQWLLGQSVPRERLQSMVDAKELSIVRKAYLYDKLKSGQGKVLKKVAKAPKGLRSTTAKDTGVKLTGIDTARNALKQSGTKQAAAELMKRKREARQRQRRH